MIYTKDFLCALIEGGELVISVHGSLKTAVEINQTDDVVKVTVISGDDRETYSFSTLDIGDVSVESDKVKVFSSPDQIGKANRKVCKIKKLINEYKLVVGSDDWYNHAFGVYQVLDDVFVCYGDGKKIKLSRDEDKLVGDKGTSLIILSDEDVRSAIKRTFFY